MSSEVPDGFVETNLQAYCSRVADGTHTTPVQTTEGKKLATSKNIKDGRLTLENAYLISVSEFDEINKRSKVDQWDILISMIGTVGEVCLIDSPKPDFAIKNVGLLKCGNESRAKWLYFFLRSPLAKALIEARKKGTTQQYLSLGEIRRFPVFYPADDQCMHFVTDALSALDDRIALLRETSATLEAIAQALFKSWFVDFDPVHAKQQGLAPEGMDEATAALFPDSFEESELGLVPRGWKVHRLGDVVFRITKGTTPTTLKRPFVTTGINFVKAESMTGDGGFIPEKFAFIDNETHELLRRSQLEAGDVLISIAGTIGRIAVMTEDFLPANTNQAVALIRPLQDIFPSGLVSRFLQRSESQQIMGERVVQAVQANLSLGTLSDLKLIVPPANTVRQLYETGLAQIDATKVVNHQKIRTLAALRDTLLPRLISGQLRLPEAEAILEVA